MTQENRENRILLFLLGFLAFWANGDNYAVAPLLINIASDLRLEISRASLSVTAYMLSFGFFTVLFGPLGDKLGRGRIIKVAAFGTAVFSIAGGFAFNLTSLIVFRAFNGLFAAGIFPVTMALIGERFGPDTRQNAIGSVMGMMFLGGASSILIGGALAQFASWRAVYVLYGAAELILAFFVLIKLRSGTGSHHTSFFKTYGTAFSTRSLMTVVGTIFLVGYAVFGSFSFSGYYVETVTGLPVVLIGLILTSFGLGTVLGGRKAGEIRKRIGRFFLPAAGLLGVAGLISLARFQHIGILVSAFFAFGLAFVFLQSTLIMAAQNLLPSMRGTAMSLASFHMFVGGAVGTLLNGRIIAAGSVTTVYHIAAPVIAAAALFAYLITRSLMKRKKETPVQSETQSS
ncbi:MAG: MFS transporter [Spirochaetia bacterium]